MAGYNNYNENKAGGSSGGSSGGGFFTKQNQYQGSRGSNNSSFNEHNDDSQVKPLSCVIPVTAKQVASAAVIGGQVYINNVAPSHITIVGCVYLIKVSASYTTYTINDGTGDLNIRCWNQDRGAAASSGAEPTSRISENEYVRFIGDIKNLETQMIITNSKFTKITDHNEIAYHICDVVTAYLRSSTKSANKNSVPANYNNSTNSNSNNGMSPIQRQMLDFIRQSNHTRQGSSIIECIQRFKGANHEQEIRKTIDYFINEGLIYSTIDEVHFKSVD